MARTRISEKKGRPNIGSAWVVIECPETGDILLGKRAKSANNNGQWNLFGGGIEVGETAQETAIRELREEAGITVSSSKLIELGSASNGVTVFALQMNMVEVRNAMKIKKDEISKVRWFEIDNLPGHLHKSVVGLMKILAMKTKHDDVGLIKHDNTSMRSMLDLVEGKN